MSQRRYERRTRLQDIAAEVVSTAVAVNIPLPESAGLPERELQGFMVVTALYDERLACIDQDDLLHEEVIWIHASDPLWSSHDATVRALEAAGVRCRE